MARVAARDVLRAVLSLEVDMGDGRGRVAVRGVVGMGEDALIDASIARNRPDKSHAEKMRLKAEHKRVQVRCGPRPAIRASCVSGGICILHAKQGPSPDGRTSEGILKPQPTVVPLGPATVELRALLPHRAPTLAEPTCVSVQSHSGAVIQALPRTGAPILSWGQMSSLGEPPPLHYSLQTLAVSCSAWA